MASIGEVSYVTLEVCPKVVRPELITLAVDLPVVDSCREESAVTLDVCLEIVVSVLELLEVDVVGVEPEVNSGEESAVFVSFKEVTFKVFPKVVVSVEIIDG